MNHVPTWAETIVAVIWLIVALLVLRAVMSWLVRSRELVRRIDELESLVRVIGAHLNVPLPAPAGRKSLRERTAALYAQTRNLLR